MRVFLDTNVLVSAFATRGVCEGLLRYVLAEHDLVTGEVVLAELERILLTRFRLSAEAVTDVLLLLQEFPVVPRPDAPSQVDIRDADDAWVLASALAAEADVLVTGDKDLLDLRQEQEIGIQVMDPREFLRAMGKLS